MARRANDTTERKWLQGIFRTKAKADREAFFYRLADEAEADMHYNDLKPVYKAIKRLRGDIGAQKNVPVMRKDGQLCSSQQEVLQWWCEHSSEALNHSTSLRQIIAANNDGMSIHAKPTGTPISYIGHHYLLHTFGSTKSAYQDSHL